MSAIAFDIAPSLRAVPELPRAYSEQRRRPVLAPPTWLSEVYRAVARDEVDDALDQLFDRLDDALLTKRFDLCDQTLHALDVGRLDTTVCLGVLTITRSAAPRLARRSAFLERVRGYLRAHDPDRADELLSGLS